MNHERWLVSYADFITLLFAFFVVLFASSQSDKKKQVQLAAAIQTAFSHMGIFEPHAKQPALTAGGNLAGQAAAAPIALPLPPARTAVGKEAEQALARMLTEQAAAKGLPAGSVTVRTSADGLVISLKEAGFFASGAAEVRQASVAMLNKLARSLPPTPIRIEGHTDNVPIHTAQFATNWGLSAARAVAIARVVLGQSEVRPADVSVAGYAEFRPLASNATEAGRALNRRVDIILLSPPAPSR